jgi:hypothetical protein
MDNHKTKSRYFALGLLVCHLIAAKVYEISLPDGVVNPKMSLYVQMAVNWGIYLCLYLGAVAGFTFAHKILSPMRVLILSFVAVSLIIGLMLSGILQSQSLEVIALLSLILGAAVSWLVTSVFGASPNNSFNQDALPRAR